MRRPRHMPLTGALFVAMLCGLGCSSAPEPPLGDPAQTCFAFRACGVAADGASCGTCDDGDPCTDDRCVGGYRCGHVRRADSCACQPRCGADAGSLQRIAWAPNGAGGLTGLRGIRDLVATGDGRFLYVAARAVAGTRGIVDAVGGRGGRAQSANDDGQDGAVTLLERVGQTWFVRGQAPISGARALALSDNERRLFVGDRDSIFVAARDQETGDLFQVDCPEVPTAGLLLASQAGTVVAAGPSALQLLQVIEGCLVALGPPTPIEGLTRLRLSEDGTWLYALRAEASEIVVLEVGAAGLTVAQTLAGVPGLDRPDDLLLAGDRAYVSSLCADELLVLGRALGSGALTPLSTAYGSVAAAGGPCPNVLDQAGAGGGGRQGGGASERVGNPGALTLSPRGDELWVSARFGTAISRFTIDGDTLSQAAEIDVMPGYVDFAPGGFGAQALEGFPGVMMGWTRFVRAGAQVVHAAYMTGALAFIEQSDADPRVAQTIQQGDGGLKHLGGAYNLDLSPDGRHLYVAARNEPEPAAFALDALSGALTELPWDAPEARADAGSLTNIVVARPDGRQVYAVDSQGGRVLRFERDTDSGALTAAGELALRCGDRDSFPVDVVSHPAGRALYIADFQVVGASCLHVLARDPGGALSLLQTRDDDALAGLEAIVLTQDGSMAYTAAHLAGALTRWRLDAEGRLSEPMVFKTPALEGAEVVALSPDERLVFATSPVTSSLLSLARGPDGALSLVDQVSEDGDGIEMVEAAGVALSPDGHTLVLASRSSDTLNVFEVQASGRLHHVSVVRDDPSLDWATGVVFANDGRHVLATAVLASDVTVWRLSRLGLDGCGQPCR